VAQQVIVNDIKDYLKEDGLRLSIEDYRPNRSEGSKEERIAATLEWRYEDLRMWHYKGGYIEVLEDELIKARPKHDDTKDALASAVSIAVKPKQSRRRAMEDMFSKPERRSRFGGY
jgi:hypothetical protein